MACSCRTNPDRAKAGCGPPGSACNYPSTCCGSNREQSSGPTRWRSQDRRRILGRRPQRSVDAGVHRRNAAGQPARAGSPFVIGVWQLRPTRGALSAVYTQHAELPAVVPASGSCAAELCDPARAVTPPCRTLTRPRSWRQAGCRALSWRRSSRNCKISTSRALPTTTRSSGPRVRLHTWGTGVGERSVRQKDRRRRRRRQRSGCMHHLTRLAAGLQCRHVSRLVLPPQPHHLRQNQGRLRLVALVSGVGRAGGRAWDTCRAPAPQQVPCSCCQPQGALLDGLTSPPARATRAAPAGAGLAAQ